MGLMVFGEFSKMVENMPPEAVLKTLDLECRTIEDDLEHHRLASDEDAISILCFRQFIRMAQAEDMMSCLRPLPVDHLKFYRETIARLVNARELPASAMEQFAYAFP